MFQKIANRHNALLEYMFMICIAENYYRNITRHWQLDIQKLKKYFFGSYHIVYIWVNEHIKLIRRSKFTFVLDWLVNSIGKTIIEYIWILLVSYQLITTSTIQNCWCYTHTKYSPIIIDLGQTANTHLHQKRQTAWKKQINEWNML